MVLAVVDTERTWFYVPSVYSATERMYCDISEQGPGFIILCARSLFLNFALNREAFYVGLLWSAFLTTVFVV